MDRESWALNESRNFTPINHSTKDQELRFAHLFPHHLATMALPWAKAQAAYPSATLALCRLSPTLALATYPRHGRADQQGGQQWPQGQQANPTQKARKAICCPLLLPGTLTRLQMRSLQSDPRRRAAENFTSLSAETQTLQRQRQREEGEVKGSIGYRAGSEAEKDSGLLPPSQAQLSLASLGRGLGSQDQASQGSHTQPRITRSQDRNDI